MSGPKRTSYAISARLYQQQKRERNANRLRQINEISAELTQCTDQIQRIMDKHQQYAQHVSARVESWMYDVNMAINGDLRDAWRGLNGIKNYLNNQETRLDENAQKAKQRQDERAKLLQKRNQEERNRVEQQNKILEELESIKNVVLSLQEEYGEKVSDILKNPQIWIAEAEIDIKNNPRAAENSIKGIQKYLNDRHIQIENIRQEVAKEEKVQRILESLKSVESDYPDIMNEGIKQRIEIFTKQLQTNSDNENTIKQVNQFKELINEKVEESELAKQNQQYVAETFASALGSKPEDDGQGGTIVSGEIDGVPITVELNDKNNDIHLDTPTDGSCSRGLDALQEKLENAQIQLGDIKVVNTGQTIRNKPIQQMRQNRLKA